MEPRTNRRARWAAWGSGIGAIPLALLMVFAPAALGAHAAHVVVLSAPYSGVTTSPSSSWSVAGCAHATIGKIGAFKPATGVASLEVRASTSSCTGSSYGSGDASTGVTANVPLKISHATTQVVVVLQYRVWSDEDLTNWTSCSSSTNASYVYCTEAAYAYVYADLYVVDTTTNSGYWYGSYWSGVAVNDYNEYYCYNGTCSNYQSNTPVPSQNTGSFTSWINVTHANPSDSFALEFSVSGYAYAYVDSYGASMTGGTASATVNAASGGEGLSLSSITIG